MRRLLLPIIVLGLAVGADRWWLDEALSPPLLLQLSRGIFALVFLLGWRFRRGRIAWATLVVAIVAEALRLEPESEVLRAAMPAAVALLLPLHLAVVGYLHEWRVLSAAGALRFGVLALEAAAIAALHLPAAAPLRRGLQVPLAELAWLPAVALPQAAALSFLAAAVLLVIRFAQRRTPIEAGLLGALAASFIALALPAGGDHPTYHLTTAGLILGLSLLENAFSLAFEDGLTGLPARRALEETMLHLGGTFAIAMVDLDRFKRFNDRHGHEVGDQVLRMVGGRLAGLGGGGKAFRYGGEEFTVVFPGKSAAEAAPVLEDLRRSIAGSRFAVRAPGRPRRRPKSGRGREGAGKSLKVTVSIGLAERSGRRRRPEEVIKAADKALYRSKKAGRNRVTIGR
ncbi:MAG: GGDEF domain-containing protein [bacterium]|nr:GGDEF domain-containing protein [bacterium]